MMMLLQGAGKGRPSGDVQVVGIRVLGLNERGIYEGDC